MTLGHQRAVMVPSLIRKKAGDRIKTNRRDAATLAVVSGGEIDLGLGP
jgi:transposase